MTVEIKTSLTQERLKFLVAYDLDSGLFTWVRKVGSRGKVGTVAGTVYSDGYRYIQLDGRQYRASRLAHLYVTGQWPVGEVDHLDNDLANDAWRNLELTRGKRCSGKNKLVVREERGHWRVPVVVGGKLKCLGVFHTPEEARDAYERTVT